MRKCVFILFLLMFFPIIAFNQQDEALTDNDQLIIQESDNTQESTKLVLKDRIDTDIEVGTSFSFSPGNYYGPSYYMMPSLSYRVSPRFYLSSGIGIQYSTFYPLYQQAESANKMLPMTQAYLFARGSYLISPRLVVNGTVYKSVVDAPQLYRNSGEMKYNYQGMSIGFQYKVSKSFSFGFQMNMQNGYYQTNELIPASGYVPVPGF